MLEILEYFHALEFFQPVKKECDWFQKIKLSNICCQLKKKKIEEGMKMQPHWCKK